MEVTEMNGRRIAVGLSLLCALSLCAFAAPGAMAAKGSTAFTCVEKGGQQEFGDADCSKLVEGKGKYGHVEIKAGEETSAEFTNAGGAPKFEGEIGGVKAEILCLGEVNGAEKIENVNATPMRVSGNSVTISFTECVPVGALAFDGCTVINGEITIENTTNKTVQDTMDVEFNTVLGNFGLIRLKGCKTAALNGAFSLKGVMKAIAFGALLVFTEESTKELELAGSPASLTATLTLKMTGGNAISYTTTN
jgi:hypothetical protein